MTFAFTRRFGFGCILIGIVRLDTETLWVKCFLGFVLLTKKPCESKCKHLLNEQFFYIKFPLLAYLRRTLPLVKIVLWF